MRKTGLAVTLALLAGCASAGAHVSAAKNVTTTSQSTTTTVESTTTTTTTVPVTTTAARPITTTTRPPAPAAAACPSNLARSLASTYSAHQLVTVESSGYATAVATVTLWQKSGSCWVLAAGPWSGFIGYRGFSDQKREGDGTTPTGIYGFGPVVYGNAPDPGVHEAYHQLVCGDWWDEDPSSAQYNTFQHWDPCNSQPPWASGSEALWTETKPYPSFAVIDYNTSPVVRGAGSAIFLHASTGGGTAGCVSVPLPDLDTFLRWMQPSEDPLIVMGPASEITRF